MGPAAVRPAPVFGRAASWLSPRDNPLRLLRISACREVFQSIGDRPAIAAKQSAPPAAEQLDLPGIIAFAARSGHRRGKLEGQRPGGVVVCPSPLVLGILHG